MLHAFEGGGAHPLLQEGIVDEALHTIPQSFGISDGNDEAFDTVGKQIFRAGVGRGDDRAAAGEGLSLDECQTFFDAGKHKDVTGIHKVDEARLGYGAEELHVLLGQLREEAAYLALNGTGDAEALARMPQGRERLKKVGDAFSQADGSGEEDLKPIGGGGLRLRELLQTNAIGKGVYLFRRNAHRDEGSSGEGGGNGNGVREAVDLFFAAGVAIVGVGGGNRPAAVLLLEDVFLKALVGGASIADEDASLALDLPASGEAGAGKGDEGVRMFFAAELPGDEAIEGESVCVAYFRHQSPGFNAKAAQEHLRRVDPGIVADEMARDAFAFEPTPREGGIDPLQMAAMEEFPGEFKVVEDPKGGLDDTHAHRVIG